VGERLSALAARGQWAEMPGLISDEMLAMFAVTAPLAELAAPLKERYVGLLDRVTLYRAFAPDADMAAWKALATSFEP
jgi:hypothetical protein